MDQSPPWWLHAARIGHAASVGIGAGAGIIGLISPIIPGYGQLIGIAAGAAASVATVIKDYADKGIAEASKA